MSGLYDGLMALADESDDEVRDAIAKILRQQEQRTSLSAECTERTLRRPATQRLASANT